MFRKRDTDPNADPMVKEDDEETPDLQSEKDEEALDPQSGNDEETLDLGSENDKEALDLRSENDENHHDLQPENIVEADPVPSEPAVKPIDLPESKPLTPSPKMTPAADPSPAARTDPQANKRLIVGQGIRLSGEINSCDRLVVEGEVEVTLNDTLALEITSSGRFTGGCEVEEADISGIYEGDLTVRNTLFVRGTGRITGTIRYGQLELERGGQIAGNISVLGNDMPTTNGDAGKARLAKAPLFGDGKPS